MANNSQSRKWNIELNSVDKFGLTDEVIIEKVKQLTSVQYFCLSNLEKTKVNNVLHKHLYIYSPSPIYFSRLKSLFETAHIEKAYGSFFDNRAYCQKSGKWADNKDKTETVQDNSFYEEGSIPETEQQENNPLEKQILDDFKNGLSVKEVIEKNPKLWHKKKQLDEIAYMYLVDNYLEKDRDIVVTFISGKSNVGKTTFIYNLMKDTKKVFRMHNYRNKNALFDGYDSLNHSCIMIDEFLGNSVQLDITEMNIYLGEHHVINAPARFQGKILTAKYIFILSNLDFSRMYSYEQEFLPDVYAGFERRIHNIWRFEREPDSNILKIYKIKHTKDIDIMKDMKNIEFIEEKNKNESEGLPYE